MRNQEINRAIDELSDGEWDILGRANDKLWDDQPDAYRNYWRTNYGRLVAIGYVIGRRLSLEELIIEYSARLDKLAEKEGTIEQFSPTDSTMS